MEQLPLLRQTGIAGFRLGFQVNPGAGCQPVGGQRLTGGFGQSLTIGRVDKDDIKRTCRAPQPPQDIVGNDLDPVRIQH